MVSHQIGALFDTIQAMRNQERGSYKVCKTLCHFPDATVNSRSRYKMMEWCYQIAALCTIEKETVAIASSYVDRYLMVDRIDDRKQFQLLCMTSLYTAVKIHETKAMPPSLLVTMSKGCYTLDDIEQMERQLLTALRWYLHPPTPHAFVRDTLMMFQTPEDQKLYILNMTNLQLEHAILDCFYIGIEPSTLAFAAIANAITATDPTMDTLILLCEGLAMNLDDVIRIQNELYVGVSRRVTGTAMDTQSGEAASYVCCANRDCRMNPSAKETAGAATDPAAGSSRGGTDGDGLDYFTSPRTTIAMIK